MPTYEYECTKCGFLFEEFQSITAAPLERCPECDQKVKRLIGKGSGIVFKGSGFYATDYRSPKKSETPSCPNKGGCNKDCDKK
ncbi:MAG: zinc ribbon domain-containing protein [Candidatus Ancaeobacter aquaticus]|nr:zinc ribbon domain-containing protein [Candidatus Ancaeobacter aquaticus]